MSTNKREEIEALLESAAAQLEQARKLSVESGLDDIYFNGPTYGMGGWITSGEWQASSNSC